MWLGDVRFPGQPLLANEINEIYANTYKTNNPGTHTIVGDIRKVCELNLKETLGLSEGEVDLLAGGPPCPWMAT